MRGLLGLLQWRQKLPHDNHCENFVIIKLFWRRSGSNETERPKIYVRRNGSLHVDIKELFQSDQGKKSLDKLRKVKQSAARHRMRRVRRKTPDEARPLT